MMASVGVIVAVAGRDEGELAAAIDAHPRLAVVRRCADLAEAVAAARAGVAGAVVISDQARLDRTVVASLNETGLAVVGVPSTPEAGEQLAALGVGTVALATAGPDTIVAEVLRSMARHATQAPVMPSPAVAASEREGEIIAVWGPAGAPGRTTIATNVAAEHARSGARTLLVDADVYGGAVAQAIGLTDETAGIAGVVREAQHGSVDAAIVHRYSVEAEQGLWVLTGITRSDRWPELAPAAVQEVLRAASRAFDAVIVDVGFCLEDDAVFGFDSAAPARNGATLAVLRHAGTVIAVGSAEPLGIQRLIHGIGQVREAVEGEPVVVINRVRAEVAGPRPAEAVADLLARFAAVERVHVVPWDPAGCDAAVRSGQVLAECAPRSRARKAIAALAKATLSAPGASTPPRRPRAVAARVRD